MEHEQQSQQWILNWQIPHYTFWNKIYNQHNNRIVPLTQVARREREEEGKRERKGRKERQEE
jgi:hypothetical protein